MRSKSTNCKRLQGAVDARRRARRRTFVLQVPDNKADAVPCERLQDNYFAAGIVIKKSESLPLGNRFVSICFRSMNDFVTADRGWIEDAVKEVRCQTDMILKEFT